MATKFELDNPPGMEPPPGAAASAVINPYALAQVVAGRPIDWSKTEDVPGTLESILGMPYHELFDPQFGGPLYLGQALNANGSLEPVRDPLLDVAPRRQDGNDLEQPAPGDFSDVRNFKDLMARLELPGVADLAVRCIDWRLSDRLQVTLQLPQSIRRLRMAQTYTPEVLRTVAFDSKLLDFNATTNALGNSQQDWTPPGASWQDAGDFFRETAEFFDPVQGAVANCYFIAAMSAVAWATPYRISHQTRATGTGQDRFFNRISFYKPDSQGALDRDIEVTDTVPKDAWGTPLYAHSSESGESWPAIYEKAFAKLKTGTTTDHPDILATGWGDPCWATAQLTGGSRAYYDTASRSADQLWNTLRSQCMSYRTIRPVTAWTYGSGDSSPDKVDYSTANIVASHAYTVLGWAYQNCRRYILLRNPWGNTEATISTLDATVYAYDVSWWRPIALKPTDGVFALEISAFKRYFACLGVVG